MSNVLIISGSPTKTSRSSAISSFLEKKIQQTGNQVRIITVRELPPEDLVYANFNSPVIQQSISYIKRADAIITVSPVYKASYPGLLKSFFDLLPEKSFNNKTLLPIATGGTIAHLLTLEYSFRPLFSVLGAKNLINGVFIVDSDIAYNQGDLTFLNESSKQRLEISLDEFLSHTANQYSLIENK
ncbi:NADPH-dependent FMN reductase [Heyndrickxia ginsengihumi]|uniref:NADPH-dependent FMN reductase n=1 Tax=Heyndrickxia ginsengihumi TaxID=363870 RepID=UPI00046F8BB5|nr:NADPH-dependent FMN reductase [Heyndrickxia ginsengihumi]